MNRADIVFGAGGFIGGHLVQALLKENREVIAVDIKAPEKWHQLFTDSEINANIDLRYSEDMEYVLTHEKYIGTVYQLAADMGGIGFIETHKADCMSSVLINANLLHGITQMKLKPEHVFFSSSACVYPQNLQYIDCDVPLAEYHAYPANPENGYGWEKLFSERLYQHYMEDYGIETRVARFHNIYGSHGDWNTGREKAPAAICRKVATAIRDNKDYIEIWGDGKQRRSFTYIDDCIKAILQFSDSLLCGPINIGSSEVVTIDQLAEYVMRVAGRQLDIKYINGPIGVGFRNSDNTFFKQAFGWEPSTPLKEGIRTTYNWIEEQVNAT